jgi:hypothetical protein
MTPPNPYAFREERRRLLEDAYRDGLIREFTQVPGDGTARATWVIVTYTDPAPVIVTTAAVPMFVNGLRATTAGPVARRPEPGDMVPIPVRELAGVYGVQDRSTMRVWLSRGVFPAEYVQGADRSSARVRYDDAFVTRRDALHWGRSTGRLNPDGTPSIRETNVSASRNAA